MKTKVLILPGMGNSGPEHWQTLWENSHPDVLRVQLGNWNNPVCSEWLSSLEAAVSQSGPQTVLVAHSLACLLVAHWAQQSRLKIKAALLVAVPNPESPDFPKEIIGFSPTPKRILPFKSIVVASTNDPFATTDYARSCAAAWGSHFVSVGAVGHINAASGLGSWSEGYKLLEGLKA